MKGISWLLLACVGCAPARKIPHSANEDPSPPLDASLDTSIERDAHDEDTVSTPDVSADVSDVPSGFVALPCGNVPAQMACIPGGPFVRGLASDAHRCDQEGRPHMVHADTTPQQTIWLSTFWIDVAEVTNAEYQACVRARGCHRAGPVYPDFSHAAQPITGVTWFDAQRFCAWKGKRLPTESEWEKAARGPDGDTQPWGNEPADCTRAVIRDATGRSCGIANAVRSLRDKGRVLHAGTRPAGRYGLVDMVGNAEEWVFDWYSPSWSECGAACEGIDPLGPCKGASPCAGHVFRGVRGGSWYWPASHATGYHRRPHYPNNTHPYHHFGFRCAQSVTP